MIQTNKWLLIFPTLIASMIPTVFPRELDYIKIFGETSYLMGVLLVPSLLLLIYLKKKENYFLLGFIGAIVLLIFGF